MNKVKILHCADFHFDTPFKGIGEEQSKINKEDIKKVFKNIIHICNEKKVDILLLAGDIFDNYTINRETIFFIEETLKILQRTRVFISPGNHDPYSNSSFYKLVKWPENVYIFKGPLEKVAIHELKVNVWGAGFNEKYTNKSLIKGTNNKSEYINIMVIHGELSTVEGGNEYNPILLEEIRNSGMDYIALGHRHSYSGIKNENTTYYAYSGCPQGRGFDELGEKGVIYGYVFKGGVDLNFINTSIRTYEEIEVDISNSKTYEEIRNIILRNISVKDMNKNFYRIILKGELEEEFTLDENILALKLKDDFLFCKLKDKTTYKYNLEELSKGYSVKGIFIKKLLEKLQHVNSEEEKEIILLALKHGIASLSEGEVRLDDY